MLIYSLALAVALGSFLLFSSAFFLPRLHRKDDFFWSAVGLFYALDLWVCRESIRGGVLLGQVAVCALLFSLGWQMWRLRVLTPDVEGFSLLVWLQNSLFPKKQPPVVEKREVVSSQVTPIPEVVEEIKPNEREEEEVVSSQVTPIPEVVEEIKPPVEKSEADSLSTKKAGFLGFLGGIFSKNKAKSTEEEKKSAKKRSIVEEIEASWEEEDIVETAIPGDLTENPEEIVTTVTEIITEVTEKPDEEIVTTVTETITEVKENPEEVITTVAATITEVTENPEKVITTVTATTTEVTENSEEIVTTVTETITEVTEKPNEVVTTVAATITQVKEEIASTVDEFPPQEDQDNTPKLILPTLEEVIPNVTETISEGTEEIATTDPT